MTRHTSADLVRLLRARYPPGMGWAVLEQVRVTRAASAGPKERFADAVVLGLWRSNRYELIGVEVKTSRADWLRERRDPDKAAALERYCDRFYLMVPHAEVVRLGELPGGWGMLVPREVPGAGVRGTTVYDLVEVVRAPRRSPEPVGREVWAGLIRRTVDTYTWEGALRVAYERALRRVDDTADRFCRALYGVDEPAKRELRRRLIAGEGAAYEEARAMLARAREEVDAAAAAPEGD